MRDVEVADGEERRGGTPIGGFETRGCHTDHPLLTSMGYVMFLII